MGREHRGLVEVDGVASTGRALLETDEIVVRGEGRKVVLPRAGLTATLDGDRLHLAHGGVAVVLSLGASEAARWAAAIAAPRGRLQKLGVGAQDRVVVLGTLDQDFLEELAAASVTVVRRLGKDAPLVVLALPGEAALAKLPDVRAALAPNGVLWTVRRKGRDGLPESLVRAAAHEAGLVDVKVARFSETHTAEKWVVPKEQRRR